MAYKEKLNFRNYHDEKNGWRLKLRKKSNRNRSTKDLRSGREE